MAKTTIQELGEELLASGEITYYTHTGHYPRFFDTYYIKNIYVGATLEEATETWLRLQFKN